MDKVKINYDGKDILVDKDVYDEYTEVAKKFKLDANETAFLVKELEYKKAKSYDTLYKQLKYSKLLPISFEIPSDAKKWTYDVYTKIGMAAVIAHYAQNAPRVDIYKTENSVDIRRIGSGFGYDRDEIRNAQRNRVPLNQKRVETCVMAIETKHNDIAWNGDSEFGLQGFIDFPGILEYTVPATGTGTTKTWSTKTAAQIYTDLTGIMTMGIETTNGVEVPDTIIMPIAQYLLIKNTTYNTVTGMTILQHFKENYPEVTIDWVTELKTAGASSTDRFMAYKNSPDKVTYEIPLPYSQLPPEVENFGFTVNAESKSGGVRVYYPYSVIYGDGI